MNSKEYIELATRTENRDFDSIRKRMLVQTYIRLDHAAKGLVTEAGEFTDVLKKYEFYGKDFDVVNLVEELGDLLWYVAIACDTIGTSFEEIMERNIAKLKARYGEKFNEEGAINRDLKKERDLLEYVDQVAKTTKAPNSLFNCIDKIEGCTISYLHRHNIERIEITK